MYQEEPHTIYYKIMPDRKYKIYVSLYNDRKFYKIKVTQNENGVKKNFYKQVFFRKDIDLNNGTEIIIEEGFENIYENKKDKYNPISAINITKFRIATKEDDTKFYNDYFNEYDNDGDINITDTFLD